MGYVKNEMEGDNKVSCELHTLNKKKRNVRFSRKSLKQNISIGPIVSGTNQVYGDKTNRLKKLEIKVMSLLMPLSKKNTFKWSGHLQ